MPSQGNRPQSIQQPVKCSSGLAITYCIPNNKGNATVLPPCGHWPHPTVLPPCGCPNSSWNVQWFVGRSSQWKVSWPPDDQSVVSHCPAFVRGTQLTLPHHSPERCPLWTLTIPCSDACGQCSQEAGRWKKIKSGQLDHIRLLLDGVRIKLHVHTHDILWRNMLILMMYCVMHMLTLMTALVIIMRSQHSLLKLDPSIEILEEYQELNQDVSPEVTVAQLQVQQLENVIVKHQR